MPSRRAEQIKRRLSAGEVVYSAWLTFPAPEVAEVLAGTGFDVMLVDLEHCATSLETLGLILAAVTRWDPVVIVRVPGHDPALIKRVLDLGADGIMAPMVMDAAEARAVVAAVKYPPDGTRGYGPRRASNYFRDAEPGGATGGPFRGGPWVAAANDRSFVLVQIEHPAAVARADEIAAVPGLDVLCLGPADLALRMGRLDDQQGAEVQAAFEAVFAAARVHGLPVCMGRYEPAADQPALVARGARLVIASDDLLVLRKGFAEHLEAARAALGAPAAG